MLNDLWILNDKGLTIPHYACVCLRGCLYSRWYATIDLQRFRTFVCVDLRVSESMDLRNGWNFGIFTTCLDLCWFTMKWWNGPTMLRYLLNKCWTIYLPCTNLECCWNQFQESLFNFKPCDIIQTSCIPLCKQCIRFQQSNKEQRTCIRF